MNFVTSSRKKESPAQPLAGPLAYLLDQNLSGPALLFRGVLFILATLWSGRILFSPVDPDLMNGFWHLVNLPFHEAGHVLFGFLPPLGVSLMGSGLQLLMPLVCAGTLLVRTGDQFGAAVAFWWFGENFLDIAPYVADARSGTLPLLGGNTGADSPYGFHDWEFILTELNAISQDQTIAALLWNTGKVVIVLALIWGGAILLRSMLAQRQNDRP